MFSVVLEAYTYHDEDTHNASSHLFENNILPERCNFSWMFACPQPFNGPMAIMAEEQQIRSSFELRRTWLWDPWLRRKSCYLRTLVIFMLCVGDKRLVVEKMPMKENKNNTCVYNMYVLSLPSRELTYPPKMAFWRWFSFSQGGIC